MINLRSPQMSIEEVNFSNNETVSILKDELPTMMNDFVDSQGFKLNSRYTYTSIIGDYKNSTHKLLLLYNTSHELIGFASVTDGQELNFKVLHCSELFIKKEYRSNGFGMEYLKLIEEYAKQKKYNKLELRVMLRNKPARQLYRKFGFEPVSEALEKDI